MKKIIPGRLQTFLTALICFAAVSSLAVGEDRFSITVEQPDKLAVLGPKGDHVADLTAPTIAQTVTIGDVSFQLSYGRNANGDLSAILTPSSATSPALHFTVLGKSVDADKAVVTLIFSSNLKRVTVNASYGGRVEVNSHRVSPSQPTP